MVRTIPTIPAPINISPGPVGAIVGGGGLFTIIVLFGGLVGIGVLVA